MLDTRSRHRGARRRSSPRMRRSQECAIHHLLRAAEQWVNPPAAIVQPDDVCRQQTENSTLHAATSIRPSSVRTEPQSGAITINRSSFAARNVLLFTMVADGQPYTTTVWDIFFHMRLDTDSHSALIEQCKKLVRLSETLQHWVDSPYGPFLKMCTEYTLTELRRHWSLYIDMQDLPRQRLKAIRDAFTKQSKSTLQKFQTILGAARSSGPLMIHAAQVTSEQFRKYWSTGTTFSDPKQIAAAAALLNPTFVYSLGGEGCSVHYGIDPIVPFHLAALFGNAKGSVSVPDVVKAAKSEFGDWCAAFHAAISSPVAAGTPVTRFFLGEATAVCRAVRAFAETKTLNLGVPVAQWKTQLIQLSEDQYVSGDAPATFNVIETSNLDDHIGLLNVLIATVPLLSNARSSVLYTESLLARGQDATKEFAERLYADITTIGLLIGICPVDYLSGFTSRCNTHELMTYQFQHKLKEDVKQFHQVTTWKSPLLETPSPYRGTNRGRLFLILANWGRSFTTCIISYSSMRMPSISRGLIRATC